MKRLLKRVLYPLGCTIVLAGCATTPSPEATVQLPIEPATQPTSPAGSQSVPAPLSVPEPAPVVAPPPAPEPVPVPRRNVSVAAVGDLMLGTDFPNNRLGADDGASLLEPATPTLAAADIAFGNVEGVLMDGGTPFKTCSNPSSCYLFRSPARYAAHLAAAGIDVVSLANNHARDFGEEGRSATMAALDAHGIAHSGRHEDVASWQVNDSRVALIAFAPHPGSHDLLDIPLAASLVTGLAAGHDIVLVSFHGGGEGVDALHLSFGPETYLGEQRGDIVAFSRAMIDAGADLILGHGPHVPRAMEVYRDRLIAYSLGNFATYYGISVAGMKGLAPLLVAELAADGRFLSGRIESYRQLRPAGPVPDASAEAFALLRRLSQEDLGPAAPAFTPNGGLLP